MGFFGSLPLVEVDLEAACIGPLLRVHVRLEVGKEFLEGVDRVAMGHVADQDGSLEDCRHLTLSLDLFDSLLDHFCDLGTHNFWHLAAVFPEDIRDALLPQLSVDAHVEFEVFMDQHGQEFPLAPHQMSVVLRTLVQHDVGQLRLYLLDPGDVVLRELEGFFGIVFKLDRAFVGSEVLTRAKSIRDAGVSLLLPAASVAVNGRAVRVRLAGDLDPFGTAAAVDSQLSLARCGWTRLLWVTGNHTLVATLRLFFKAASSAAIFLKVFKAVEAATGRMAHFLALVSARKQSLADLTTVRSALMAEETGHEFFAAVAETGDLLKAGRTVARVALHRAGVSTSELFLARSFAGWHWDSTLNGWLEFSNPARAEERLGRHVLARLAETNVAKICTLMEPTAELLVALGHAEMTTFRVWAVSLDRAAHFLALVLLALFQLVADPLALQVVNLIDLFSCHHLGPQLGRVVDLVTRILEFGLVAEAAFVNELFAAHALVVVALLDALVSSTRQELLAKRVTNWNWLNAGFALPPQQAFN